MTEAENFKSLKNLLKEGFFLNTSCFLGEGILGDAANMKNGDLINLNCITQSFILLSSDMMINQTIYKPTELIWDLFDTRQTSLCIKTKASSYINKSILDENGNSNFIFLNEGPLSKFSKVFNKPLVFHMLSKQECENISFELIKEFPIDFSESQIQLKRIKLGQNGEIELIHL